MTDFSFGPYTDEEAQDAIGSILTDSASVDFTYDDAAPTITADVLPGGVDHGGLAGLGDDDHTQYPLLLGRSGGQTLAGGTGASDDLVLQSTTNAVKGVVVIDDLLQITAITPTLTSGLTSTNIFPNGVNIGAGGGFIMFGVSSTVEMFDDPSASFLCVNSFFSPMIKTENGTAITASSVLAFFSTATVQADGAALTHNDVSFLPAYGSYGHNPSYSRTNGGTGTVQTVAGFWSFGIIGGGWTCTDFIPIKITSPFVFGTVTNLIAIDIAALTGGSTLNLSLRSAGSTTEMRHAGPGVFGANAAPTNGYVALEAQSTTKAFLPSRMTTTQRDAMTAVDGMVIYNSTTTKLEARENGAWVNYAVFGVHTVRTITSSDTASATDEVILCNAASGAITVTLPAANGGNRYFYIKKIDSTANAVTVDGASSETIDDVTTRVLSSQYDSIEIVSDGSEWWII